jgi:hypothetical protein
MVGELTPADGEVVVDAVGEIPSSGLRIERTAGFEPATHAGNLAARE